MMSVRTSTLSVFNLRKREQVRTDITYGLNLRNATGKFSRNFALWIMFNNPTAHRPRLASETSF